MTLSNFSAATLEIGISNVLFSSSVYCAAAHQEEVDLRQLNPASLSQKQMNRTGATRDGGRRSTTVRVIIVKALPG